MLILSRVCADFYDKHNNLLHRITVSDLGRFQEAPESIKQDPLFQMLVDDGSIKYPADDAKDKALEQDPFAGTTAEGKEIKPKAANKQKATAKAKNTSSALRAPSPQGEGYFAGRSEPSQGEACFAGHSEPSQGENLNNKGDKSVEEAKDI